MKKTVTEIFDNLSNEATEYLVQKYEIKENVDDMSKQRVYSSVMNSIDEGKSRRTGAKRGLRKTSIAAVAIVAALAIAGTSVAAGKLYKSFTDYKPAYTEEQKAAVEKATFAINRSTSGEGVTVTAVEGLYDGERLFVLANIEVDSSKVTIPQGHTFHTFMRLHKSGDPTDTKDLGCEYLNVLERNGNTCTVLYVYNAAVEDGQKVALVPYGLITQSTANATDVTEPVEHDISLGGLQFTVQKTDFAKTFSAEKGVKLLGTDVTAEAGYLSPWYARFVIKGTFDGELNPDDTEQLRAQWQKVDEQAAAITFKVVMKDGTEYEGVDVKVEDVGGGSDEEGKHDQRFDYFCSFKEYVDTANVDHVEVNDVKVSVR